MDRRECKVVLMMCLGGGHSRDSCGILATLLLMDFRRGGEGRRGWIVTPDGREEKRIS